MPQAQVSRRSLGFRPLITCEDPRGVVECGTIRKTKTNPTQKGVLDQRYEPHRRKQKDLRQKADKGAFDNEVEMEKKCVVCTMDSFEESKRVIRDGVGRKGVQSELSSEETSDDRQMLDSSDLPSTSSSQSSVVFSGNLVSAEAFLSSATSSHKKERRLNLTEKLMGVEDAILRSFPYSSRKIPGEGEKIVDQKKPRKHENEPRRLGSRRMKIEQLIEAVMLKGLHRSSRLCGAKPSSDFKHTEFSYLKDKWDCVDSDDRRPAIVIMKPVRFSCRKSEQPIIPKSRAKLDEEMPLKMRMRNCTSSPKDESETLDFNEGFKGNETASSVGKSRSHKVNGGRRKGTEKCETFLHSHDGDNLAISKLESSGGLNNAKPVILTSAATENRRQGSEVEITDYANDGHICPSETPLLSSIRRDGSQCATAKKSLKALLLSNRKFINRVEELFKVKVNLEIHKEDVHSGLSVRVLLDCANELIERIHHESHRTSYPYTSLDQLLVEVCDRIEALSYYRQAHGEMHSTDDYLLLLVKGDLRRGMLGGVWDLGWECLGLPGEVEEITRRVSELIFGGLIEEILVDLTFSGV